MVFCDPRPAPQRAPPCRMPTCSTPFARPAREARNGVAVRGAVRGTSREPGVRVARVARLGHGALPQQRVRACGLVRRVVDRVTLQAEVRAAGEAPMGGDANGIADSYSERDAAEREQNEPDQEDDNPALPIVLMRTSSSPPFPKCGPSDEDRGRLPRFPPIRSSLPYLVLISEPRLGAWSPWSARWSRFRWDLRACKENGAGLLSLMVGRSPLCPAGDRPSRSRGAARTVRARWSRARR
jgi:hypothetical protein